MSPQEVRALIEGVIDARVLPQWYLVLLAVFVAAVLGGVIAWGSSYFQVKAQNFAKKEDFNDLKRQLQETTSITEEIKARISGDEWLKQKRQEIKLQYYSLITEHLGEVVSILSHMLTLLGQSPKATGDIERDGQARKEFEETWKSYLGRLGPALELVRRSSAVVRIAVAPEVRTLLSTFGNDWNAASEESSLPRQMTRKYEIAHKAWTDVMDIARWDLFGEPRETAKA